MIVLNKPQKIHSDEVVARCVVSDSTKSTFIGRENWKTAHRLDFETSGCLLICDPETYEAYALLFRSSDKENPALNRAKKIYLAGCDIPSPLSTKAQLTTGFIVSRYRRSQKVQFLNSWNPDLAKKWHSKRPATHWVSKLSNEEISSTPSILEGEIHLVELVSGARHQIRAYFASLGSPIKGDPTYGPNPEDQTGLQLHAWKLEFKDPIDGTEVKAIAESIVTL